MCKRDDYPPYDTPNNFRFTVRREVIEHLEIMAPHEDEAVALSSETPIDYWTRDIKSHYAVPSDRDPYAEPPECTCTAKSLNPCGHMDECPLYRDPVEVYGTPEHEMWLMEMEARGDYQ